jgi:adenine/guanine phosphoribosyltransferase-like PRPP-binding protein
MPPAAHEFWQDLHPPGTFPDSPCTVHRGAYPSALPDGRQILLPIRILPRDGSQAVASLIVNQASFAVQDALADAMAAIWRDAGAEVVIGVPMLGLPLADALARRLGHERMVPLGTSRKFWYEERLSEPLKSITTPGGGKDIYLDPRMLPLLEGRRVLVVDDVVSSGSLSRPYCACSRRWACIRSASRSRWSRDIGGAGPCPATCVGHFARRFCG